MFLSTCEIMSTIIGALAGSIASSRVKMDLFGVIVCGTLAALGGGTVRDILLDIPVYWTLPSGEIFVLASVVTSLATFYVAQKYPPPMGTIRVADAIVLALFGMIGTEKSYLHGYTPTVSVMMGICTGVAARRAYRQRSLRVPSRRTIRHRGPAGRRGVRGALLCRN